MTSNLENLNFDFKLGKTHAYLHSITSGTFNLPLSTGAGMTTGSNPTIITITMEGMPAFCWDSYWTTRRKGGEADWAGILCHCCFINSWVRCGAFSFKISWDLRFWLRWSFARAIFDVETSRRLTI